MESQEKDQEQEQLDEQMRKLEEDPPKDLADWPDGAAKYKTFGGGEGDHGYDEGPEAKLGPSGLVHKEDGSVEIDGEEVEDPSQYKGEPIPGGPTDPNAPALPGEEKSAANDESEGEEQRDGDG